MKKNFFLPVILCFASFWMNSPMQAQWTSTTSPRLNATTGGTVNVGTSTAPAGGYPSLLTVSGHESLMGPTTWTSTQLGPNSQSTFRTISPGGQHNYWHMFRGGTEVGQFFTSGGTTNPNLNVNARLGTNRLLTNDLIRFQLNWTRNPTINTYPALTTGYTGLSNQQEFFTAVGTKGPFSRLHLAQEYGGTDPNVFAQEAGYRPWMQNGITFTGNSGQAYIGHKYGIADVSDLVFQWGDDQGTGSNVDRLRFIFTSDLNGLGGGMGSTEGLEAMRMYPRADKDVLIGIGDFNEAATDPTERLDILNGKLRIRTLPDPLCEDPSTTKVMVVGSDGVVGWREEADLVTGGSGSSCEWTMNGASPNHIYTGVGAPDANCPDDAEMVGIGVDPSTITTDHAKFIVSTDDFDQSASIAVSGRGTNSSALFLSGTGTSTTERNIGLDVDLVTNNPANLTAGGAPVQNFGIRVNATGPSRRVRGVSVSTSGASVINWAGEFLALAGSTNSLGVLGESYGNSGVSRGVVGQALGQAVGIGVQGTSFAPGASLGAGIVGRLGLAGQSADDQPANVAIGVWGVAYGPDDQSGTYGHTKWAGYFSGDVEVEGTLYNLASINSSDRSIKQNINELSGTKAIELLGRLRPRSYEYDAASLTGMRVPKGERYGLIAQEVQEVLPQLVEASRLAAMSNEKGEVVRQERTLLGVNYIELIPLLIAGYQEQENIIADKQAQIDALNERLSVIEKKLIGSTGIGGIADSKARLDQNAPNPFNENTVIRFFVPEGSQRASVQVMDVQGKEWKTFDNLTIGDGQLVIGAGSMPAGSYSYTLFVDGEKVATRTMVITQ